MVAVYLETADIQKKTWNICVRHQMRLGVSGIINNVLG